jgi:hypothetical protein
MEQLLRLTGRADQARGSYTFHPGLLVVSCAQAVPWRVSLAELRRVVSDGMGGAASREGEELLALLGGWGHEGPRSLKQIKNELMLAEGGEEDTEEGVAGLFGWDDEEEDEGS